MTAPPRPTAIEKFPSADVRWAPALLIDIKAVAMAAYRGAATISAIAIPPAAAHPDFYHRPLQGWLKGREIARAFGFGWWRRDTAAATELLKKAGLRRQGNQWLQPASHLASTAAASSPPTSCATRWLRRSPGWPCPLGAIFNGAIITEEVLGYPGIFTLLIGGVRAGDYSLVLGVTTVSMAVSIAVAATTRRAFVDGQAFTQP